MNEKAKEQARDPESDPEPNDGDDRVEISAKEVNITGDVVGGGKYTGDTITTGDISGSGVAIGRGASAVSHQGNVGAELDALFPLLLNALRAAPPEQQAEALQKAEALKEEMAKGEQADDTRMAKLIDGLVELVPGAVGAVTSMFASPILGGLAGNVTKFVLEKIQGK